MNIFYKEGYDLSNRNAKSLSKIAEIAASEKEFGIATSLSILAAEESLKAVFLFLKYINPRVEIDDFDKIFHKHKTKHEYLVDTAQLFQAFSKIFFTEGGLYYYLIELIEKFFPEEKIKETLLKGKTFLDIFKKLKLIQNDFDLEDSSTIDSEREKEWWQNANLLKNQGLYVDMKSNRWHSPKNITEDDYQITKNHTQHLIIYSEKVIDQLLSLSKVNNGIPPKRKIRKE